VWYKPNASNAEFNAARARCQLISQGLANQVVGPVRPYRRWSNAISAGIADGIIGAMEVAKTFPLCMEGEGWGQVAGNANPSPVTSNLGSTAECRAYDKAVYAGTGLADEKALLDKCNVSLGVVPDGPPLPAPTPSANTAERTAECLAYRREGIDLKTLVDKCNASLRTGTANPQATPAPESRMMAAARICHPKGQTPLFEDYKRCMDKEYGADWNKPDAPSAAVAANPGGPRELHFAQPTAIIGPTADQENYLNAKLE